MKHKSRIIKAVGLVGVIAVLGAACSQALDEPTPGPEGTTVITHGDPEPNTIIHGDPEPNTIIHGDPEPNTILHGDPEPNMITHGDPEPDMSGPDGGTIFVPPNPTFNQNGGSVSIENPNLPIKGASTGEAARGNSWSEDADLSVATCGVLPVDLDEMPVPEPGPDVAVSPPPPDNIFPEPNPKGPGESREVLRLVKSDLTDKFGIDPEEMEMHEMVPVEWPDASLGYPQPDAHYAQVITPGFVVLVAADGQFYAYHTSLEEAVLVEVFAFEMEEDPSRGKSASVTAILPTPSPGINVSSPAIEPLPEPKS